MSTHREVLVCCCERAKDVALNCPRELDIRGAVDSRHANEKGRTKEMHSCGAYVVMFANASILEDQVVPVTILELRNAPLNACSRGFSNWTALLLAGVLR